jgi:PPK2 family polyphosphate:nucleotide phosphotransferase
MAKARKKSRSGSASASAGELAALLRVGENFRLGDVDPRSTPGFTAGKAAGARALSDDARQLSQLQERLFAAGRGGDSNRSVLLVVQGMDTAGKGGIVRHVVGSVDPQGVQHTAFKAPTPEELSHDFLWRIRPHLPEPGMLGVFDRSQYEDVLIVRVHDLVPEAGWEPRYAAINEFEASLVREGTVVVKVMLHISPREQLGRLAERLVRPDKYWKYNVGDLTEHGFWSAYQEAYQVALTRCSTGQAPWFVVPADRKWYARWAVQQLLIDALAGIDPQWPAAGFDVDAERHRLLGLMKQEAVAAPKDLLAATPTTPATPTTS